MATVRPIRSAPAEPVALHSRAMDNLRYIRETMERAGSFTAVPGAGGIAMGVTAVLAALVAWRQVDAAWWLVVWLVEAVAACALGLLEAARKSRRIGMPLLSGPGRKFLVGFVPPLFVGALLTWVLFRAGLTDSVPAVWLLLYGTGVVSGGSASVKVVPVMGLCFMILGTAALFAPPGWHNWILAAGFGGIHIAFGSIITVKYGG